MRYQLLSFVVAATVGLACGGSHASASTPAPSVLPIIAPTGSTAITLTGRVTESPPTPSTGIDGAVVTIGDGVNVGRSAVTNPFGFYTISGLKPGVFTVGATADGYVSAAQGIAASGNTTSNFQLTPTPSTMTHVLTGDLGADDGTCSDSVSQRPCRIVAIPIHNAGPVEAVLSWTTSRAADLDLTLFQAGFATPIARSAAAGAGPERISTTLTVGATYEFRITYAGGMSRAAYTLRVTHLN